MVIICHAHATDGWLQFFTVTTWQPIVLLVFFSIASTFHGDYYFTNAGLVTRYVCVYYLGDIIEREIHQYPLFHLY